MEFRRWKLKSPRQSNESGAERVFHRFCFILLILSDPLRALR
jgi:hypothetical protein